ncbi:phytase [Reichenbachiella ulvae]|uniref:Phytase n=1 Tax=Reichenbachiella ulvae TaxID=2980104 RepID=A0ABT3CYP1_9BACT|nr:phytase [Reichenbachiella ulvae]MCV9388818.1 phytase [Reichenbachiella ulvae]
MNKNIIYILGLGLATSCLPSSKTAETQSEITRIQPKYVTDSVNYDSDDPAIWIHPSDPAQSLILGTDKGDDGQGGVFVFDLQGNEIADRRISNIDRPNNVDIAYGFQLDSTQQTDIAVFSERGKEQIRVFSLPDMNPIDGGGLPVFEDSENRLVMGVALYKRADDSIFAIVSRKGENAPTEGYLYQYLLYAENGTVKSQLVRKFGKFSGGDGEIEAIAVDAEAGYIYYSDELYGIRKYYADPNKGNEELALFGLENFTEDREGISIYPTGEKSGYILISDQQNRRFHVYPREGSSSNPHQHNLITVLPMQVVESDGSEVSPVAFNADFPKGIFVAMSDNRTFEIYDWRDLEQAIQDSTESQELTQN